MRYAETNPAHLCDNAANLVPFSALVTGSLVFKLRRKMEMYIREVILNHL